MNVVFKVNISHLLYFLHRLGCHNLFPQGYKGIMAINLSPMAIPIVTMVIMNQAVTSSCLLHYLRVHQYMYAGLIEPW